MAKLIFIGERFAGRVYELAQEKTTVGRGGHNTLALHDGSVSMSHCEILVNGPEVIVRDLGSANGTFVNGVRVKQQCQIKSGQTVRFGLVEARLELELPEWEDTAAEESAVFAARRYQRKQEQENRMPRPSTDPVTLDSDAISGFADQTVLLPPRPHAPETTAPPQVAPPPDKISRLRVAMMVAAAASGIAFLLWLIFWRK